MAPKATSKEAPTISAPQPLTSDIKSTLSPPSRSTLPTLLKFPLVVVIALSVAALSNTLVGEFTGTDLAQVSRVLNEEWQVGVVAGWKILELGVGWFGGFDDVDMLSLTILTHVPHAFLLHTFYMVPAEPVALVLVTTSLSHALPFYLLRRRNAHNQADTPSSTHTVTGDSVIRHTTALLATLMYAIPLVVSCTTWLPMHLAVYFSGLRTLDPAHGASIGGLLILFLPLGYAAQTLLFTPAAHSSTVVISSSPAFPSGEQLVLAFDPETATLSQTLHRNIFWHMYMQPKSQELLKRGVLLTAWTAANVAFTTFVEVEGCEALGALGWAGVWAVGAGVTALTMSWVGLTI